MSPRAVWIVSSGGVCSPTPDGTSPSATLIFVTHDVADTLDFPRVLVIEQGRIVEEGSPRALYQEADSRYRTLCDQEQDDSPALIWSARFGGT